MKNELPKTKIDERTGIEYRLEGDYYIPNLILPKQETISLNKYGRMDDRGWGYRCQQRPSAP